MKAIQISFEMIIDFLRSDMIFLLLLFLPI